MRAAIYIRVSSEEQAQHGYSLPEQEEAGRKKATELGANSVLVFKDDGYSGKDLDSPGLSALREVVRAGQVDVVICRDLDRFARKLSRQLLLTEEFERAGVRLEFLDFTWQDTPEGRLFMSVRGAIAEFELEKIRDRMMRGKFQKAKMGGVPHRFDVYGYNYDPATGRITLNEAEAAVVREIFWMFLEEGRGAMGIARELNLRGVPTKRGGRGWAQITVKRMLLSETYTGVWWFGKLECKDSRSKKRRFRAKPREEWLPVKVPPIIDRETWERAQEKLKEARRLWAGRPLERYLLSGLVRCADCGGPMHGEKNNVWGHYQRVYTCRIRHAQVRRGCPGFKSVRADYIEEVVWRKTVECLRDPDAVVQEALALQESGGLEMELQRLNETVAAIEKGREKLIDALSLGLIDLNDKIKARLADMKRRKEQVEARLKTVEAGIVNARLDASKLGELRKLAEKTLARLDDLSTDEKRVLIRTLVKEVTVEGRGRTAAVTVILGIPAPVMVKIPAEI